MKRKVVKNLLRSGRSAVVVIPKWWTDLHGLKTGDEVELEVNARFVLIKPIKGGKCDSENSE